MNCTSCGHANADDARFCEECGEDLPRACAGCGTANAATAKFCKNCRSPLTGEAAAATAAPESPPAPKTPPLPSSFGGGRYTVRAFLGEGAKKRVYLAHDTRLDRDVAFALIKTEGLDGDGVVRIRREAQAMGRLGDHPHIVTVFDAGEENGAPFIVSQHMSSGSVEDLLATTQNHRVSPEQAMRIGAQIADALAHAHARGIIHRDLKPGNVWLDGDGNAALGDFGLAVAIDRSRMTMQGMMVGTVAYMSPEQALGRAPDARSDLYSLGAMLYEMVAGRPPFLGDDAVGVISQHINTAPVTPSWHEPMVPSPLESLILRLLAKSPDERPATAQEVARELRQIIARSTITEHPHGMADEITDLRQLDWGRFVGRRDEMAQLKGALEHALSGKMALAFIAGEPGIGKTRLAEEFTVYAELRGAQVLTGRSYEGESTVPYRPFVEALRQYVRGQPDGDLRQQLGAGAPEIASMVSEVRQRFPDIQEAPKLEGDAERLRMFDSITGFLRNASIAQPLVVLLDDLHWVDRPSLLLLQHIARHATNDRLLLMATYRDVELERTHPLSEALAGFRRMERFTRIPLRGLPEDEVYELLTSIEGAEETAAGRMNLAQAIWRETEGNPFFIKEVLQHLVESGKLVHEHGQWTAGGLTVDDLGIPEGVREVIGRRLSRLSEDCNAALTRASAMTRGFTWDQFRTINASAPEDELLDLLDEALRSQLVLERKGEVPVVYDFTHALIRQTLYEELSTPRRVLLHREIGRALEELYAANIDAHVGELAYHFYQAAAGGEAEKAIDYCTRAGDRAAELNGHDDAIEHYGRALQIVESSGDDVAGCAILLRLGEARFKGGVPAEALDTYRHAADAARRHGLGRQLATAAMGFAEAAFRIHGDPTLRGASVAMLTEALDAVGDGHDRERARMLGLRARASRPETDGSTIDIVGTGGYTSYFGGRDERAVAEAAEAVEIARRVGDPGLIAFALNQLRGCKWRPENPQERLGISQEMMQRAEEAGDLSLQLEACVWISTDYLELGQISEYEANIDRTAKLADTARQPFYQWLVMAYRANVALYRGDLDKADRLAEEALAFGQRTNAPEAFLAYASLMGSLRSHQHRYAEVDALYTSLAESSPNIYVYAWSHAATLATTGDIEKARAVQLPSIPLADMARDWIWSTTVGLASQFAFSVRDAEIGAEAFPLMEPLAGLTNGIASVTSNGSFARHAAMAAAAQGDLDTSERYFNQAIETNDRMFHRPDAALSRMYLARVLLEREATGDRERALALVELALDEAQKIGMPKLVQDCLALKIKAQGIDPGSMSIYTSIDRVASAAAEERPAVWRDAVAPDGTVTIMFSDIEDSTVLTEKLGDQRWQDLLRQHDAIVRAEVEAHDGFVVKHLGDGFMVVFQSAKNGLACAIAIQQAFAKDSALPEPVRVRIGLHAGEALREGDDFFGKNVIMASRVAGKARGGEILVSALLHSIVESGLDAGIFGPPQEVELKGLAGTHTVYAVSAG